MEIAQRFIRLAKQMGVGIAATRAVVEKGWLPPNLQIGQSGISVAPDIYVGLGVSGASQHVVGIRNAKKIIAVNLDMCAPILKYADYVLQEDVENVLRFMENYAPHPN